MIELAVVTGLFVLIAGLVFGLVKITSRGAASQERQ